ncbi:ubiquitin carboxyl-terminal hydrolase 16 [Gouania willdenowi]|uniref:Ubiquitin carboxyl-terminal hydrolase n=1 Tax=Gouania willdenowi TaxID=441366 RepID=A0A8C5DUV6_GOUWI|nr:ubiquitin carboxyl-terminal hydrolase 16 [Gouania willdenowi]
MGKKRAKDKSPKDEDDLEFTVPSCRHIRKGTEQTLLKKLSSLSDWTSCEDCKHEQNKENISGAVSQEREEDEEEEEEGAAAAGGGMWMCLKCGHRGCGRNSEDQHAIKHYETPRSDPHCLVVSLDNWSVWCYLCDDEVQYSRTGQLAQLVSGLKKQTSSETTKRPQKRVKEEEHSVETEPKTGKSEEHEEKEKKSYQNMNSKKETARKPQKSDSPEPCGLLVKGLSNLGNTCFFNAVVQNLSQTQLLRPTLHKVIEEKQSVNVTPNSSVADLEPLMVQPEPPGSLTVAMCHLLTEIQETKKSVVAPRELFSQVCKKAARFKGFQQQDSQELLRYLLDGMRAEELKRVSAGVLETLKLSKKMTDGEELKTLVKAYEKNGHPKNFVDHVFGGEMTSTVMCQQCKTVSVVTEMFLDLSLPVADEAYRKKNVKKGVLKPSVVRQEDRNSPGASTSGNEDTSCGVGSKYQQKKAKKQAKKQSKKRQQKFEGKVTLDGLSANKQTDEELPEQACESPQNPISLDAIQVELEREDDDLDSASDGDSSATAPSANNRFTILSERTASMDQEAEGEEPELVSGMEKVSLDDAFIENSENTMEGVDSEEEAADVKEYTVTNQDPQLAFHTLAPRTAPEKQECSVQSCLFQFTEVETLTQTNSLLCVTCSKRQQRRGGASNKKVYTDALKQMLISTPPLVLTLHLKRFQQNGYSICKVNRHVQFPLILDLAPFSAVTCKNVAKGDSQILYSLYGIVEHSGTMRSGHYTAYVKVRPACPKSSSNGLPAEGPGQQSKGSWFHISDTSVQPVSESKVQSCQAYLLFYERIL